MRLLPHDPQSIDWIDEVCTELDRATEKFPTWPSDPFHALAVLGEEYGELNQAVLQFTYEPGKATMADIKAEAVQTAAMAARFLMSVYEYDYVTSDSLLQPRLTPVAERDCRVPQQNEGNKHGV